MLIDGHVHATPRKSVTRLDGTTYPTPDEVLAVMDREGIDRAVLLPGTSPEGHHRLVTTEDVLEMAAARPVRFIPFMNIDPRLAGNDAGTDFSRLLRYYTEAGCRGLGELTANLRFDDPLVWNLFRQCEAWGVPVLFHIGPRLGGCYGLVDDLGLPGLERALKAFPNLVFLGHSQPFWAELGPDVTAETRNTYPKGPVRPGGRLPVLFDRYPNLHGDLSAMSGFNAVSRDPEFGCAFLARYQDRLLFGNDLTSTAQPLPLRPYLREEVAAGRLAEDVYEKIAWLNANRLFRLGLGETAGSRR